MRPIVSIMQSLFRTHTVALPFGKWQRLCICWYCRVISDTALCQHVLLSSLRPCWASVVTGDLGGLPLSDVPQGVYNLWHGATSQGLPLLSARVPPCCCQKRSAYFAAAMSTHLAHMWMFHHSRAQQSELPS